MASQNDTMRGPTNYYRTGTIRFNEEKGRERGSRLTASALMCVFDRWVHSGDVRTRNPGPLPPRKQRWHEFEGCDA